MPNFTLSNVTDNKEGPSGVVCLYIIYHLKTSITHETSFTDIILRHRSSSGKLVLSFQTQRQNLDRHGDKVGGRERTQEKGKNDRDKNSDLKAERGGVKPSKEQLCGGEWTVASVGEIKIETEENVPYVNFAPDGRFYASDGCNVINGDYVLRTDGFPLVCQCALNHDSTARRGVQHPSYQTYSAKSATASTSGASDRTHTCTYNHRPARP